VRAVMRRSAVETPSGRMVLLGLSLAVSVDVRMVSKVVGGIWPVAIRWMMMARLRTWCGYLWRACQCSFLDCSGPGDFRGASDLSAFWRWISSWCGSGVLGWWSTGCGGCVACLWMLVMSSALLASVVNLPGDVSSVVAREISPAFSRLVMFLAVCCLVVVVWSFGVGSFVV